MKENSQKIKLKKQKLRNNEYYNMQKVYDDLYAKSKNNETFRNLYELIINDENIKLAYRNIKKNKGSKTPGTDNKTIKDIEKLGKDEYINLVKNKLENYHPKSVRRVEIPKPDGKKRPLGIPCIEDRLIQQCIKQVLEPICEGKFHEQSYGFRPNRSCEHAIAKAMSYMNMYKMHYVVDIDIKGFFDNVNHGKLLKQLWAMGIRDKKVISIISKILKSPIDKVGTIEKGTPQGGIISPLLANVVLNEMDWWISNQWDTFETRKTYSSGNARGKNGGKFRAMRTTKLKEMQLVRYADDFKIFCKDSKTAFKVYNAVKQWLKERLDLEISPEKSKVTNLRKNYTEFLGFKLKVYQKSKKYVCKSYMTEKSKKNVIRNLKIKVKKIQKKLNRNSVNELNATILGAHNYYKIATGVNKDFHEISFLVNKVIDIRLKKKLSKKYKPTKTYERFYGEYNCKNRTLLGITIYPIHGVKTRNAMHLRKAVCNYTQEGRELIHKNVNIDKLIVKLSSSKNDTTELADNKISLLIGQSGKCFVTKNYLEIGNMECHHKIPKEKGGTDKYENLVWVTKSVHKMIHCKYKKVFERYAQELNLKSHEIKKVLKLRELVENSLI